jgi:hypothetical protein
MPHLVPYILHYPINPTGGGDQQLEQLVLEGCKYPTIHPRYFVIMATMRHSVTTSWNSPVTMGISSDIKNKNGAIHGDELISMMSIMEAVLGAPGQGPMRHAHFFQCSPGQLSPPGRPFLSLGCLKRDKLIQLFLSVDAFP